MPASIIDQYHGDSTLTVLLAALNDRPAALDAVKHASFGDAALVPSRAYAWEEEQRYPVHTREDAIASLAYRAKYAGAVPAYVDAALEAAADAYGISGELFAADPSRVKVAAAPAEVVYALPDQERLPLGDAEQVKVAAEVLLRDGHVLDLDDRVEAMAKVAFYARAYGVPMDADVHAYAGENACHTGMLRDRIGMRVMRTKIAGVRSAFEALEAQLEGPVTRLVNRGELLKLASHIHELDVAAGITGEYGKKIFDPMKTVFNDGTLKLSAAAEWTSDGADVTQLMNMDPGVWADVDLPELGQLAQAGDAAQFKQVWETLPLDMRQIVMKHLGAAMGQGPQRGGPMPASGASNAGAPLGGAPSAA